MQFHQWLKFSSSFCRIRGLCLVGSLKLGDKPMLFLRVVPQPCSCEWCFNPGLFPTQSGCPSLLRTWWAAGGARLLFPLPQPGRWLSSWWLTEVGFSLVFCCEPYAAEYRSFLGFGKYPSLIQIQAVWFFLYFCWCWNKQRNTPSI